MNVFLSLGRWIFPVPFAMFGLMHFMNADALAAWVPSYMPAPAIFVYLAGAGLIGAAVSMYIGKYDKLAATLLAIMLLLFVLMMHMPGAMGGGEGSDAAMGNALKDLGLAAGSMIYATTLAKDRSIIG
jgi:uncharacterized membrane protein YphA (DoxX/SURF4 family)